MKRLLLIFLLMTSLGYSQSIVTTRIISVSEVKTPSQSANKLFNITIQHEVKNVNESTYNSISKDTTLKVKYYDKLDGKLVIEWRGSLYSNDSSNATESVKGFIPKAQESVLRKLYAK